MKVLVVFEFEEISADSEEGDAIVQSMLDDCDTMRIAFNATNCWVQEVLEGGDDA